MGNEPYNFISYRMAYKCDITCDVYVNWMRRIEYESHKHVV